MAFSKNRRGFTLVELVIVVAIMGVLVAVAAPGMGQWIANQKLKAARESVATALSLARGEAIRTGNRHLVFFVSDALGNALQDAAGAPVPILVLEDSTPGAGLENCLIDAGERTYTMPAEDGVNWGVAASGNSVATDFGAGVYTSGSTFTDGAGNAATWIMFQAQGMPLSFSSGCALGAAGSGAGAVYLTNGNRDYAVVVSPLGAVRVHAWDAVGGQWTN